MDSAGPSAPEARPAAAERRAALALFTICLLAYGYFLYRGPHHNPDSRLALTYSLVERGRLDIDPYAEQTLDRALRGGHYYSDKAPGLSFLLAPLYGALRVLLPASTWNLPGFGGADRFVLRYLLTYFGVGVPAALFCAAFFRWLARWETRISPRLAVAAGLGLGSPAYPFAVSAFGHLPAAMCLFGAFVLLSPGRALRAVWARGAAAGALLGLGCAVEYPVALPAAAIAAWAVARRPGRRCLGGLAAGAGVPLALLAVYHWLAFGAPWATGYAFLDSATSYAAGQAGGLLGVSWPNPAVAVALLVGPHRGLVVHAPWLALAAPGAWLGVRRWGWRSWIGMCGAVFGALWAVNSGYYLWDGGASWGPRHLVPALPFVALLALPAAGRWPRLSLLLAGASVALTAAAVATGTLPDSEVAVPLTGALWPRALAGSVANNWGQLLGLAAWRGLVPLAALALVVAAWAAGLRRAYGWLACGLWALGAVALLHRHYLEYSEGYYLYLGSRLAAGARLYADTASTQPPLLPLVISLLWHAAPDVYLPRLLAIGCYVTAAILAGRLAAALSGRPAAAPLAVLVAALLPLGAAAPQTLDANAMLAALAPAAALLALAAGRRSAAALATGALAALGLAVKLTFAGFTAAPAVALLLMGARRNAVHYALAAGGTLLVVAGLTWHWAGPAALDGLFGELESPLLPAGALLGTWHLMVLEGPLLALGAAGWWLTRHTSEGRCLTPFGLAAVAMPLFGLHQGTFVGVARPAEPLLAAYAATAVTAGISSRLLRWPQGVRRLLVAGAATLCAAWPATHSAAGMLHDDTVDPVPVLARLEASGPGDVLAPPYYAALAGRRMLFDYPDWTVWGMREAAGRPAERALAGQALAALDGGRLGVVAADFRLDYIRPLTGALAARYVVTGNDGDVPARRVTFWSPA